MDAEPQPRLTLHQAIAILRANDWKLMRYARRVLEQSDGSAAVEDALREFLQQHPSGHWIADQLVRVAGERGADALLAALAQAKAQDRFYNYANGRRDSMRLLSTIRHSRSVDFALEAIAERQMFHITEAYDRLLYGLRTFPEKLSEQSLLKITNLPQQIFEQHTENR